MGLRASEWIVLAYFSYLAGAAAVIPTLDRQKRRRAIGMAVAVLIAVFTVSAITTRASVWRSHVVFGARRPCSTGRRSVKAPARDPVGRPLGCPLRHSAERFLTFVHRWDPT